MPKMQWLRASIRRQHRQDMYEDHEWSVLIDPEWWTRYAFHDRGWDPPVYVVRFVTNMGENPHA